MVAAVGTTTTDAGANQYRVVLSDDFSAGYKISNWGNGFNSGLYWNGAFRWSTSDIKVASGEMQLSETRQANGTWTAGGFNSFHAGITITYGTVEFDARIERAPGTMTAILMWPKSDVWPRDGEIDILETPKNMAMHTVHWAGAQNQDVYNHRFSNIDTTQLHHYKMTWLPNLITVEVDGSVVAKWDNHDIIPSNAMGFGAMGYVANSGEDWIGGAPNSATSSKITTYIDNVIMSQWVGTVPLTNQPVTIPSSGRNTYGKSPSVDDQSQALKRLDSSVDPDYYLINNRDILVAGIDPVQHYHQYGWREGRNPNSVFSTKAYEASNSDVAAAGCNPAVHYDQFGWREGRDPGLSFDTNFYLAQNRDVAAAGINPLEHFLVYGAKEGRHTEAAVFDTHPAGGFDQGFYLARYIDVAKADVGAAEHYVAFGWREGRDPNAYFSTSGYLAANADVAKVGVDPLGHYMRWGWKEGRPTGSIFNAKDYFADNPDLAAAGVNALEHWLHYGVNEGRHLFSNHLV